MAGKRLVLSQVRQIVIERAAGYSVACIADRLGISSRTVSRICQRHGIEKSGFRAEMIDQARRELLNDEDVATQIKSALVALTLDDLSQSIRLRGIVSEVMESVVATDLESAALAARACAALSTSLLNLSTIAKRNIPNPGDLVNEKLPELVIRTMSRAECERAIRKAESKDDLDFEQAEGEGEVLENEPL